MYHRIVIALLAALLLCFTSHAAFAQLFVAKKGTIPSDMTIELVYPQVLRGVEAKAKAQELKALVSVSRRQESSKDLGPYRLKCTVLLQEWELAGEEIMANFRVGCVSDWSPSENPEGEIKALDTPLEVMAFLAKAAETHLERTSPKPRRLTPRSTPGEYVRPKRTVVV